MLRALRSNGLAALRGAGLLLAVIAVIAIQRPAMALRLRVAGVVPHRWHRWCCRLIGIDVAVRGRPFEGGPALYVANHVSYLDVSALGSVVNASFIARADVADWPVFGYLSRLQRTVFVERRARYARAQRAELQRRLAAGDSLILFPEGTSGCGTHMLAFKSTLFAVAALEVSGRPITVQPISIAYTRLDGMPLGRLMRPFYAWYGDMPFLAHFWCLLGIGRLGVDIVFHPPVDLRGFGSRKALAHHCETVVRRGFAQALAGRLPPPAGRRDEGAAAFA